MIGVILAGGHSRRMGVDKSGVEVAGRPMLDWVGDALGPAAERVVVSGRPEAPSGMDAMPDIDSPSRGPLAGLVAALLEYPNEQVALVAVDQPWLRTDTILRLAASATELAAVPVEGGIRQTTCAVYPPGLADLAQAELFGGGSLQSLLDVAAFNPVVDWHSWGEDGRSWFSVDTPDQITEGLERYGPPA